MPRQPNRADVVRALAAAGFVFVPGSGARTHEKWRNGPYTVPVPRHQE